MTVIDGTNAILGRAASQAAKKLQKGEEVGIINAEKMIITGDPQNIVDSYLEKRRIGSAHHGPYFPRRADAIVRRTVRGMLPKSKKGRAALKRLRVQAGNPGNEKGEKIASKRVRTNYITLAKLSRSLGASSE